MSSVYTKYSAMTWLEAEIRRNENSVGRNQYSDWYYNHLKRIKDAQEDGSITDEMYSALGFWTGKEAVAYGYYTANIHYDLFIDCDDKNELEDRIISFIEISDRDMLKKADWFALNFIYHFRTFLSNHVYRIEMTDNNPEEWIRKHGDEMDNRVLNAYLNILGTE